MLRRRVQDRADRLFDPEIDHGVTVVRQDDVHQVLADVVDVALDRGQYQRALAAAVGLLHVRLEVGDRGLHDLRGLQDERQLHLAGAEQVADDLHTVEQGVIDDRQWVPRPHRLVEIGFQAGPLTIDDPLLEPLVQRQGGQFLGPARPASAALDTGEQVQKTGQRVVAVPTPVIDQIERDRTLLIRDA